MPRSAVESEIETYSWGWRGQGSRISTAGNRRMGMFAFCPSPGWRSSSVISLAVRPTRSGMFRQPKAEVGLRWQIKISVTAETTVGWAWRLWSLRGCAVGVVSRIGERAAAGHFRRYQRGLHQCCALRRTGAFARWASPRAAARSEERGRLPPGPLDHTGARTSPSSRIVEPAGPTGGTHTSRSGLGRKQQVPVPLCHFPRLRPAMRSATNAVAPMGKNREATRLSTTTHLQRDKESAVTVRKASQ